ncbi:hypothetical protein JKP88DRAFT_247874 [Tribonema minus]|uniref:Sperm-tail PG-rich repeat-containing protein 2 n=1 Tax=Tribonema minus TaxID=303371 RepID=A0A835YPA8_9STRA|nr:hypothetical protein JKP88DRAFT_247874 [Tribonema minus]
MAMPVRSARKLTFSENRTPDAVGPGAYNLQRFGNGVKPAFTAFGTSSQRDLRAVVDTPGPGAYSISSWQQQQQGENTQQGTNAFVSKAPRTNLANAAAVPGPGAYEPVLVSKRALAKSKSVQGLSRRRRAPDSRGGGERNNSAPLLQARYNPPTIPCGSCSYGYNQDVDTGLLVPLPVPVPMHSGTASDSVGPGQYDPGTTLLKPAWQQGPSFAKASERRTLFDIRPPQQADDASRGGGDGQATVLSLETGATSRHGGGALKGGGGGGTSAVFKSAVQRMPDASALGPGPAAYDAAPAPLGASAATRVQRFGSTVPRGAAWLRDARAPFTDPLHDTPGPGAYATSTSTLATGNGGGGGGRAAGAAEDGGAGIGFCLTAQRPCLRSADAAAAGPGPASYDAAGSLSLASNVAQRAGVGRRGVFGCTGERWHVRQAARAPATAVELWSQAQAKLLRRVVVLHRPAVKSSAFADRVAPTVDPQGQSKRLPPPPTAYTIKGTFDKLSELKQKPCRVASQGQQRGQWLGFNSTAKRPDRFCDTTDPVVPKERAFGPGPGKYNLDSVSSVAAQARARRTRNPRSRIPLTARCPQQERFSDPPGVHEGGTAAGPGSYDVCGSLLTKTHNVTFLGGRANRLRLGGGTEAMSVNTNSDMGIDCYLPAGRNSLAAGAGVVVQ